MKITRITVYAADLPLSKPYRLSGGRLLFERLDATFVCIETDAGITGWGEGTPWGHTYLPAFGGGIRAAAELLAPAIMGLDPRLHDVIDRIMDVTLPGHLYAKAPFANACWDIAARASGLRLFEAMGGGDEAGTAIASSISTDTPDGMLADIQRYRDQGYVAHSVKVGADVALDIDRIRHLHANQLPGEFIFFDVNRAWKPAEAIQVMNAVADLPVVFEQPCETLAQCAHVRRHTSQPISIDERLETLDDMMRIASTGIAEYINIKVGRVGGLTKALRIRDVALASGFKVLVMATGGTTLADTVVQHLAATIPDDARVATWLCQDMLAVDLFPGQGSRNKGGYASPPGGIGLGFDPVADHLGLPIAVFPAQ